LTDLGLPGEKNGADKLRAVVLAALHWALRPVRALILAYSYVLTGEKVTTPVNWKDI
jgi:hypothetical protein